MKISNSKVTKLLIEDIIELDPISVILEDIEPRKGKIIIECYGESWSAYWGGMGSHSLSEFFRISSNQYIIGYLAPTMDASVVCYDDLDEFLKKKLCEERRLLEFNKEEARELFNKIEEECQNEKDWAQYSPEAADIFETLFGEMWFTFAPEVENHKYKYLSRIVDTVKAALGKATEEPDTSIKDEENEEDGAKH